MEIVSCIIILNMDKLDIVQTRPTVQTTTSLVVFVSQNRMTLNAALVNRPLHQVCNLSDPKTYD